jgi:hypothetical protein
MSRHSNASSKNSGLNGVIIIEAYRLGNIEAATISQRDSRTRPIREMKVQYKTVGKVRQEILRSAQSKGKRNA